MTSVLESLKRVTPESKSEHEEYEQVVSDDDQVAATQTTAIDEKLVGTEKGDIRYELPGNKEEPASVGNGIGNGHTASSILNSKVNVMTKLVIEDDTPKMSESDGRKLGN